MKIKICGLFRKEDVAAVNAALPDYCGFVINYPKSHRSVSPERVKELTEKLSPEVIAVGVFVNQPAELVAEMLNSGTVKIAQLHGDEDENYIARLRALTDGTIWQAFVIGGENDVRRAANSSAELVLLDAGRGSGRRLDLSLIAGFPRQFALAGGIDIQSLPSALSSGACVIDVSGGAESGGLKDFDKIDEIVKAVRLYYGK